MHYLASLIRSIGETQDAAFVSLSVQISQITRELSDIDRRLARIEHRGQSMSSAPNPRPDPRTSVVPEPPISFEMLSGPMPKPPPSDRAPRKPD
jgi:hypothetical protein